VPDAPTRKPRFALLSLAVVVLDQWSKWIVELHLPEGAAHPVVPGLLNLVHVRNTGVAFGLFSSDTGSTSWLLTVLGFAALGAVALYFWLTPGHDRLLLTALSLVAGGAVGNLLDRIAAGAVTDFVDVFVGTHHWPAFNVADSAITIGIALMVLETVLPRRLRAGSAETAAEAA